MKLIYNTPKFSAIYIKGLFIVVFVFLLVGAAYYKSIIWFSLSLTLVFTYYYIENVAIYDKIIIGKRGFFFSKERRISLKDCKYFKMDNGSSDSSRFAVEYINNRKRNEISFYIPEDHNLIKLVKFLELNNIKIQPEIYYTRAFTEKR